MSDKLHPAVEFLETLYPPDTAIGYLNFRFKAPNGDVKRNVFLKPSEVKEKLPPLLKKWRGCNVYFLPALVPKEGSATRENIKLVIGLKYDLDLREDTQVGTLPGDLKASVMWETGGGRHGIFLLQDPVTSRNFPRLESLEKWLCQTVGADPQAVGVTHCLRLPGTLNHKYNPPHKVKVVRMDPELRYTLDDFECLTPLQEEPQSSKDHIPGDLDDEGQRLCYDFFTSKIEGQVQGPDGQGKCMGLCPFHEDHHPSLSFNIKKGLWNCFGACGRGGGLKDFAELTGQTIPEELLGVIRSTEASVPPTTGVRKQKTPDDDGEKGKTSLANRLIALAEEEVEKFFTDQEGEAWARVKVGDHREYYQVASRNFREWISRLLWIKERSAPYSEALKSAFAVLSAKAKYEGECHTLHTRVAWYEGSLWIDLVDDRWRAVRITALGWEIVSNPPIIFRRFAHQKPLNVGRELKELDLHQWWNLRGEDDFLLATIWLVTSFIPDFPHPVLSFHGEHGSGKTTIGRTLKIIVDPQEANWLSIPYDKTELAQSFQHHFICPFDNVSGLPRWFSDAICSAVTGDGFSKRKLYTNDEDVVFSYQRTIILNGTNVVVARSDLMDRSLILKLDRLDKNEVKTEEVLQKEFENALPDIRATIFTLISEVLAIRSKVKLSVSPRMADFAHWGVAVAQAMKIDGRQFLQAYFDNIGQQHEMVIETSPVGQAMMSFMQDKKEWTGLAGELLGLLEDVAGKQGINTKVRGWPSQPNGLTRILRNLKVTLEGVGIKLVDRGHTENGRQFSFFRKVGENTVSTVSRVENVDGLGLNPDDELNKPPSVTVSHSNHRQEPDDTDDELTVPDDSDFQSPSGVTPRNYKGSEGPDGTDDEFATSSKKGENDEVINLAEIDISDLIEEDDEIDPRGGQL